MINDLALSFLVVIAVKEIDYEKINYDDFIKLKNSRTRTQ